MFTRFSPNLKEALRLSQIEASNFGKNYVAPEHLLLGLLQTPDDAAAETLRNAGVTSSNARQRLERLSGHAIAAHKEDSMFTQEAQNLLRSAWQASRELGDAECDTQHLLGALINGPHTVVHELLSLSDVDLKLLKITNTKFDRSPSVDLSDEADINREIQSWHNRAEMARKVGDLSLAERALEQKQKYEKLLKKLSPNDH